MVLLPLGYPFTTQRLLLGRIWATRALPGYCRANTQTTDMGSKKVTGMWYMGRQMVVEERSRNEGG